MTSPLNHGTHAGYGRGCRCLPCKAAHAEAVRLHSARRRHSGRDASSDVLTCSCGGLLAEDDHGHVFCLVCEAVPV